MNYIAHLGVMVSLYLMLTMTLNILVGNAGLLAVCQASFSGIGAYACTLLVMKFGLPFYLSLPLAMGLTGLIAYLISWPSLRLKGDFFVLATLGFQMIIYAVLNNWDSLTKGPYGISGVPTPSLFGIPLSSPGRFLLLAAPIAGLVSLVVWRVSSLPFGRTLRAIRDDELAALSLGKNVRSFQRRSFVLAGLLAAPAGALLAAYNSYVDPTNFALEESMLILAAVIIGGAGSLKGAVNGAVILILLPEALRFLKLQDSIAGSVRQILFGLALILIMRWRPKGISGDYAFD